MTRLFRPNAMPLTLAAVAALTLAAAAPAATIDFEPADLTQISDFSTNGTLVSAINYGNSATDRTVNGITFKGVGGGSSTQNGVTVAAPTRAGSKDAYKGALDGDTDVNELLDRYLWDNSTPLRFDISGLEIGVPYELQLFLEDDGSNGSQELQNTDDFGGGTATTDLDFDYTNNDQSVIGTFTADNEDGNAGNGGEVTFRVANADNDFPTLNALQLREIPEPATLALLGLGGAVMLTGRKRRNA